MCGIVAALNVPAHLSGEYGRLAQNSLRLIHHRGPDGQDIKLLFSQGAATGAVLAFTRLAIVGLRSGMQPLTDHAGQLHVIANGEIYNHKKLRTSLPAQAARAIESDSDCAILAPLYRCLGSGMLAVLRGMFGLVIVDEAHHSFFVARDHLGIIPLYLGVESGSVEDGLLSGQQVIWIASELKALMGQCSDILEFPPGQFIQGRFGSTCRLQSWYEPQWKSKDFISDKESSRDEIMQRLRTELIASVRRQLQSDVPVGILLSGGLDSSIIAAIAVKLLGRRDVHLFSIGLEHGSEDLEFARKAAAHLGLPDRLREFHFKPEEGLRLISEVVFHLETADAKLIPPAVPLFLLMREIRAAGIKVVLTGQGADELFGGYTTFDAIQDADLFQAECRRRLLQIHRTECLRDNKMAAAWGVESRPVFLDADFVGFVMENVDPHDKISSARIEKAILRAAFSDLLPPEILWRRKNRFSDGVGNRWTLDLIRHVHERVSDRALETAASRFPSQTPKTKEAYFVRALYAARLRSSCIRLETNPSAQWGITTRASRS